MRSYRSCARLVSRLGSNVASACSTSPRWSASTLWTLLVEDVLLVELKTVKALDDTHRMQCTNYLKATGLQLGLLLNFSKPRLEIKRVVHAL